MNEANYASLEASKRLVEAGIVLETDALWVKWYFDTSTNTNYSPYEWRLMHKGLTQDDLESIPAPSMAEVWRELPEGTYLHKNTFDTEAAFGVKEYSIRDESPTDALIDLLIWVRKEASNDHT